MLNIFVRGILSILLTLINIIFVPINALINGIFPNFSNVVTNFNTFANTYLSSNLGFFLRILPANFRSVLVLYFTFLVSYYGIIWSYHAITSTIELLKKVKFW